MMSLSINRTKVKLYVISVLIPLIPGAIIGVLTSGAMNYGDLQQPPLAPPAALFPVVWTILYILMGVSHGILKSYDLNDSGTETVFYAQLVVNLLWPVFFFVLKWRLFAFVWIIPLDILVITMAVRFYRKNKLAGLLQIPYVIWVLFASYLNLALFLLNR